MNFPLPPPPGYGVPLPPPPMPMPMPGVIGGAVGAAAATAMAVLGPAIKAPKRPRAMPPSEPNSTLYVRNLHETVKLESLKKSLRTIFSQYGTILDLKAERHIRMRGQAFIVFENVESATKAMTEINGFPLFSKPMEIQYARDKSFVIAEKDGTIEETKRKRDEKQKLREQEAKRRKEEAAATGTQPVVSSLQPVVIPDEYLPPNHILFVQNVPSDATEEILNSLFKQFQGFKEVRLIPSKKDIAFVEYDNEVLSAIAKESLHNYQITSSGTIKVTFAKK